MFNKTADKIHKYIYRLKARSNPNPFRMPEISTPIPMPEYKSPRTGNKLSISISVDTSEIDNALEKLREMERIYDKINHPIMNMGIQIDEETITKYIAKRMDKERQRVGARLS